MLGYTARGVVRTFYLLILQFIFGSAMDFDIAGSHATYLWALSNDEEPEWPVMTFL